MTGEELQAIRERVNKHINKYGNGSSMHIRARDVSDLVNEVDRLWAAIEAVCDDLCRLTVKTARHALDKALVDTDC